MNINKNTIIENVIIKPINVERNAKELEGRPHIMRFNGDIAGIFVVPFDEEKRVVITNEMAEILDITLEELETAAKANAKYVTSTLGAMLGIDDVDNVYVVTTENKLYGGAAIFEPDNFRELGNMIGGGVYILPSSIHELLLMRPDDRTEPNALRQMVREVNATQVASEEVLSDNVFFYDAKKNEIREV